MTVLEAIFKFILVFDKFLPVKSVNKS